HHHRRRDGPERADDPDSDRFRFHEAFGQARAMRRGSTRRGYRERIAVVPAGGRESRREAPRPTGPGSATAHSAHSLALAIEATSAVRLPESERNHCGFVESNVPTSAT